MSAEFVATGSLGSFMPTAVQGQAAALAEAQAKIVGALKAQASMTVKPPSIAGSIQVAVQAIAALQLALTGPSVALNFSAVASLVAQLQALLGILLQVKALFGGAGLALVKFEGSANGWGSDLSSLINAGQVPGLKNSQGFGVGIFCGANPAVIAILKTVFGL